MLMVKISFDNNLLKNDDIAGFGSFWGLTNLNLAKINIMVSYVRAEKSFDTTFSRGYSPHVLMSNHLIPSFFIFISVCQILSLVYNCNNNLLQSRL